MKKVSIVGTVRVPTDIADQVKSQHRCDVELVMTPNYEFHRNGECYATRALLHVDGSSYFIAQETKSSTLAIGYTDNEPDKKTRKQIKKICDSKLII